MRGLAAMILVGMLLLQGCAVVAVGLVAGAAAGVTYTVLGIAEKTFNEDYDSVMTALQKALVSLDIKTGNTRKIEESGKVVKTEIEAFVSDLALRISVERVGDKATKLSVDADRKYLMKDKATATQILNQVSENLAKKS
jgi:Protein of unknown function (DUF3568)